MPTGTASELGNLVSCAVCYAEAYTMPRQDLVRRQRRFRLDRSHEGVREQENEYPK